MMVGVDAHPLGACVGVYYTGNAAILPQANHVLRLPRAWLLCEGLCGYASYTSGK